MNYKCVALLILVVLFAPLQAASECQITGGCVYPIGNPSQPPSSSYPNPNGYAITSGYFSLSDPTHAGVDLANGSSGGEVRAIGSGQVVEVRQTDTGFGWAVRIQHHLGSGDVVYSLYGHMVANTVTVSVGDVVTKGQPIGQLDSTGVSTGPHLHFSIRKINNFGCGYVPSKLTACVDDDRSNYLDPLSFIAPALEAIYTANFDSNDISAFQVDTATGALISITGSPYPGNGVSKWLINIDPSHRFAYTLGDFTLFSIDSSTGALSDTGIVNNALGIPSPPEQLVIHPSGKFIYTASLSSIAVYSVNAATGAVTAFPSLAVSAHPYHSVALSVDPTGRFLYVLQDVTFVSVYAIAGVTGALTEVVGSPFQTGVGDQRSFVPHPSGKFLYVMGANLDASAPEQSALLVDSSTGSLTLIGQQHEGRLVVSAVIDPAGKFIYGADVITNAVLGFGIDATTGQLMPLFSLPMPFQINKLLGGLPTQQLAFDKSGSFLYVLAPQANAVFGFSVDASGSLTPLGVGPFATGLRPFWIATW